MCECYATASCNLARAKPLALTELQRHALESGDVGYGAHSAKRHSNGNVPSMTAMVVGSATAGVYMPFSALAPVECAQAAIKLIANFSRLILVLSTFSLQAARHVHKNHHCFLLD